MSIECCGELFLYACAVVGRDLYAEIRASKVITDKSPLSQWDANRLYPAGLIDQDL